MMVGISICRLITTYTYRIPRRLLIILYRSFYLLDNEVGVRLNLALLFTPLIGDPTITGKIIGFVYRLLVIIFGSIFILFAEGFLVVGFVLYFYLYYHFFTLGWVAFFIFILSLVFIFSVNFVSKPLATFKTFGKGDDPEKLVDPYSRGLLDLILSGEIVKNPQVLEKYPNIIYLLLKYDFSLPELSKFLILKVDFHIFKDVLLARSLEKGVKTGATYIGEELLFASYLEALPGWWDYLDSIKKDKEWLDKTLSFVYFAKKRRQPEFFWDDDFKVPYMGGVNRGLTGRVTPILNEYSTDLTYLASKAMLPEPVGREEILNTVIGILSRPTKNNVLIIGESGSGKTSFVNAIAYQIVQGTKHRALRFKRIVSIEPGAFFGGGGGTEAIADRFENVIREIELSGGIIAFIDEIHMLAAIGIDSPDGAPVFGILEPRLSSGNFQFIATTTREGYDKYIFPNQAFARVFEKVELPEAVVEETEKILQINSFDTERRTGLIISYPAIFRAISFSGDIIYDRGYPDKAVDVLEKAVSIAMNASALNVSVMHVESAIEEISKVPFSKLEKYDQRRLLNLEEFIHKNLIGQDEAVKAVSDAIRREVSGVRNTARPIASFLFMGPTGVGKTELAKVTVDGFFGKNPYLARFNMNQYVTADRATALIDSLCQSVRENPFSLILLDEFEKCHPSLNQAFLQILDEGTLQDSKRKEVKFANCFFVATSNIGSHEIFEVLSKGGSYKEMAMSAMSILRQFMSPELLNRFSDVVVFRPLSKDDLRKVCLLKLDALKTALLRQKIQIGFSEELVNIISDLGYSKEYGAREMERIIKKEVESRLAKMVISGKLKSGSKLTLDPNFLKTP